MRGAHAKVKLELISHAKPNAQKRIRCVGLMEAMMVEKRKDFQERSFLSEGIGNPQSIARAFFFGAWTYSLLSSHRGYDGSDSGRPELIRLTEAMAYNI